MSESTTKEPFVRTMSPVPRPRLPPRLAAGARPHGLAPGELVKLHHTLAEALETSRGVITQFVAPEPDAAIEAVVYDLAYISAAWLGERVLFINGTGMRFDANDRTTPATQRTPANRDPRILAISKARSRAWSALSSTR